MDMSNPNQQDVNVGDLAFDLYWEKIITKTLRGGKNVLVVS